MGNCKGLPHEMKTKFLKNGDILQMQKENLLATAFKDKRQILFLLTNEQPSVGVEGKSLVNICYNKYMDGVDKSDQYWAYYPVGQPGKKWWRYILWFLVNLTIVSSYIVHAKSHKVPLPPKDYDHLKFRVDIACQSCESLSSRKHRTGRKAKLTEVDINRENTDFHKVEKVNGRKIVCRLCLLQKQKNCKRVSD
ncbi:piggyBac transposable element-derived protein 3-like [Octopus sinensis]|uniref:PiggyBac transposable element-derived protein 3-like n=1 Tax=Octopus sinensis TaxID=2607531 RepID=A0A7E6EQE2_9MOLL|nr:piggyBac transposable element-derived protein 3-like [Octopus sinensis]